MNEMPERPDRPEKPRLTRAQAKARADRLRAAGITVGRKAPSTVTLLEKRSPAAGDDPPEAGA